MERKNINRGFKRLRVWNDAVELYALLCEMLIGLPFELKKTTGNCIDSAHSVSRNIAEGYCRRSIKEYLVFLNYALGSSGEFHSSIYSFKIANQLTADQYDRLDTLHYKVENRLIQLIKSLQKKMKEGNWEDSF